MKSKSLRIALLLTLIFTLAFASVAQAAGPTATETKNYQATIKNNVNGTKVAGMTRSAPMRLNVYKDGKLVDHMHLENGDIVKAKWPAGKYNYVFVHEKTENPLVQCGQYTIPAGKKVTITAVSKGSTLACVVKIRK